MRLHRFYVTELIGSKKEITVHSDELVNQISRVFRLKTGDSVVLFDGSGNDYECVISGFGNPDANHAGREARGSLSSKKFGGKFVTFEVGGNIPSRYMPRRELILCAAIVKKDTFEWIAEKATELGVTKIIPVMAERSEKKNLNEERLKKIVIEASEQSGRGSIPIVDSIVTLQEAIKSLTSDNMSTIAFHLEGEPFAQGRPAHIQAIFIGPEGGWSPAELEMFHTNKVPVLSLGTQVLRAETAVVSALSMVVFR